MPAIVEYPQVIRDVLDRFADLLPNRPQREHLAGSSIPCGWSNFAQFEYRKTEGGDSNAAGFSLVSCGLRRVMRVVLS